MTCETCRYAMHYKNTVYCRRFPPTKMPFIFYGFSFVGLLSQWPTVEATDWCGEHSPREGE